MYEYVEETTANMTTTEETTESTSITTEYPVTTESSELETTEITTPIVVHVNATSYLIETTETVTTEFTVEITEIPVITTEPIITTEEEIYETVTMHEEEEEKEKEETSSPTWYEYVEENITSTTPKMETSTKEIIRMEVTIVKEELNNITTPFVTVPEIISTTSFPFITEEIITTLERPTMFGTTLMYTLPPTSEFTMEYLPLDYLEENVTRSEEVTKSTTVTVETSEILNITREKVTELSVTFEATSLVVTRTTNQQEKKQRQEEKKEELIEELKKLEKAEEEILRRQKELESREEDWQTEKEKLIHSLYVKQEELKAARQTAVFSKSDTVTEESPALSETTPSIEATTQIGVSPMKPTTVTPAMTTKDELEEEIKFLEKKYLEKEQWLKELEKKLEEREKKFEKEKEEFETKIKELEEKLERGEEITLPTVSSYGGSPLTTPSFSQLPPTEGTTIEIRESTVMEPKTETSVRKIVTLSREEEEEQKEEEEEVEEGRKRKGTTKICVERAKLLGKQTEGLVTERVCLPFVPRQVNAKEQRTKIGGLYLKQHEWIEGPRFTKDREETQTEFEDERSERKRSLTGQNRFKRNIPAKQHVHPQFRIDQVTSRNGITKTQIGEPLSKCENYSLRFTDDSIFMVTETSKTTEKSYWKNNSNKYKVRSMLQIIENKNECEYENDVKGYEKSYESRDYEDQIERNPRQGEGTSPWTTKSANDEIEEENVESDKDDSVECDAANDKETETIPKEKTYSDEDDVVADDEAAGDKETEAVSPSSLPPEERTYSEDDESEKEITIGKTEEIPSEEIHEDNEGNILLIFYVKL